MTLAKLWRWGAPEDEIRALLPAAERAIAWVLGPGDPDGDGLVEYGASTPHGVASLANQGWKDSHDAVRHRDGSLAEGPIAMVEVQGYCHAAFRSLADLREAFDTADPTPLRQRADRLAEQIDAQFWMDDEDCFALALDGSKQRVGSVSTNAGHLLWTGTVGPAHVGRLVDRLMADDMFTGFGLRTLTSANPGYNALSYHCGSVWPHDSAIVAAGMIASGQRSVGTTLATAILEAAGHFGGRPPNCSRGSVATSSLSRCPTRRRVPRRHGRPARRSCWCRRCSVCSPTFRTVRRSSIRACRTASPSSSITFPSARASCPFAATGTVVERSEVTGSITIDSGVGASR